MEYSVGRMAKEPTVQVSFRLPEGLLRRLDAYAARMGAELPGIEFGRADAVKSLLTRALDQVDARPRGSR
jgi:hypothetical protein